MTPVTAGDPQQTSQLRSFIQDTIMHKTSLMSALALVVTLAASAGAQSTDRTDRPARPQGTEQDGSFRRGRGGPEGMLLRGITLSADQQQKLADLRTRERQEWQKDHPRGANGQNGADARPRREPGDTTGFAARRAEMEKRFEQRIADVRNILTAEQRTQFDKNVAELKARRAENGGRFGGRGAKDGAQSQRSR
jgi:Spy/CpxP family protein refolding chaperone